MAQRTALPLADPFFRFSFGGLDEMPDALKAWELKLRQLDPGPARAAIVQVGAGEVLLARLHASRRLEHSGSPPPGLRTFAVLGAGRTGWFHGQAADDATVILLPCHRPLDAVTPADFVADTLSISAGHLHSVARDTRLPGPEAAMEAGEAVCCDGRALAAFRDRCGAVYAELQAHPSILGSPELRREITHEIPALLLRALVSSEPRRDRPGERSRHRTLTRAREFIDAHLDEPPTVQSICRAAGVSWRTLDYAFQERYGLTPKAYLKAIRLHAVRRSLRRSGPRERITDVANRWGFWHMGQFAADFRRQFGDLPSRISRPGTPAGTGILAPGPCGAGCPPGLTTHGMGCESLMRPSGRPQ